MLMLARDNGKDVRVIVKKGGDSENRSPLSRTVIRGIRKLLFSGFPLRGKGNETRVKQAY